MALSKGLNDEKEKKKPELESSTWVHAMKKLFIFLIVALFLIVEVSGVKQSHNFTATQHQSNANTVKSGEEIIIRDSQVYLNSMKVFLGSTCTQAFIYTDLALTQLVQTATIVDRVGTFSPAPLLNTSQHYFIGCTNSTSWLDSYDTPRNHPVTDSYVIWNSSFYGNTRYANFVFNVEEIDVTPSTTPTLTLDTGMINGTTNFNDYQLVAYFNGSVTAGTTDIYNCSFQVNDAVNQTKSNLNLSINQNFTYDFGSVSDWYRFKINCSNFEASDATQNFYYRVDTILPVIATSFINGSNFTQNDAIEIDVNFTDSNLLAYNITLRDSNNAVIERIFATNLTSNFSRNVSSRVATTTGNYTVKFEVWDSHTKILIPDYSWEKIQYALNNRTYRGIRFNNNVELITDDFTRLNDFSLVKKLDRFIFRFNFTDTSIVFSMFVKADNIVYLPESGYPGHFIVNGKHWIDFKSSDVTNLRVDYLSDYGVWRIRFTPLSKIVVFDSIGDLNYNSAVYRYTVLDADSLNTQYLAEISANTLSIKNDISDIKEAVLMIPIVMLYMSFLAIGYWMLSSNNHVPGYILIGLSCGLDFLIVGLLYRDYVKDLSGASIENSLIWIFGVTLIAWILGKLALPLLVKYQYRVSR